MIVHRIPRAICTINTVYIVDIPIVVVINTIACYFILVDPHTLLEILMSVPHARIQHTYDDIRGTNRYIPCAGRVDIGPYSATVLTLIIQAP